MLHDASVKAVVTKLPRHHERREGEDALRESEARFRKLVEHSEDVITVVDRDATVLYGSPALQTILGYSAEEGGRAKGVRLSSTRRPPAGGRASRGPPEPAGGRPSRCGSGSSTRRLVPLDGRDGHEPARRALGARVVSNFRDISDLHGALQDLESTELRYNSRRVRPTMRSGTGTS